MVRAMLAAVIAWAGLALAGVGDPQVKTDHPWYPGELSCSTWERLFKTQAELFERVTGKKVVSDEDKALASWFWRNIHVHHCTQGPEDTWGKGLDQGEETREYWAGLFAYGFALCYADHHQMAAEFERLLGPSRSRAMGVAGHTTFEVWLTGGPYGAGQWALLDHDISTVVFTPDGMRLMGLMEVSKDLSSVKRSSRERGFIPAGLHPSDPDVYQQVKWAGYVTGYAGAPPLVHLRAGESLRRYLKPGLDDGQTFAYWGINYNAGGIPGPHRDRTWVNQPEKFYKATRDCGSRLGQARYGNAVFTYAPDFASGKYREGVIDESDSHVTFEWQSPYIIAATPAAEAAKEQWGIRKPGCTGGLVLKGKMTCPVEVSTDQGATWHKAGDAKDGMDLTDRVKGHYQYWIRLGAGAKALAGSGLTMITVCQCSQTVIPRLKAGRNTITYEASGRAVIAAGPNVAQVKPHLVEGALDSPKVTLELAAPRKAKATHVYAAAWVSCGAPPRPSDYHIDCSTDGGKSWKPVVKDWKVVQRPPEPGDWWSQTFNQGDAPLDGVQGPVRVRFGNTGSRPYRKAEAYLAYAVENTSPLKATFAWRDGGQVRQASHVYKAAAGEADASWSFDAGAAPKTLWVEYAAE
ncbi:MAG TPA: hypothetical protein PLE19_19400 [Planctomycetota bacterium]|nr:hypothetical protein [Planctomycetota bacterium]HRR81225.1 hypothetical protein [Planctomycetota bacterium]HRT93544.1 hypothetical protein [Planctomycetota bacterium]